MYNVVLDSDVLQSDSVIHTCVPSPQSRATLWDPMYYSPPGSSGIEFFQARILEWGTIPFSRGLPNPGIEPRSPTLQADSLTTELSGKPFKDLFWRPTKEGK